MKSKVSLKNFILISILSICVQQNLRSQSSDIWNEIQVPLYSSKYKFIDFQDSIHGWLCTSDGKFIITNNSGKSWTKDSIPNISGVVTYLKMTVYGNGWAFTDSGGIGELVIGYYRDSQNFWRKKVVIDTPRVSSIGNGIAVIDDSTFMYPSAFSGIRQVSRITGYGSVKQKINLDFSLTPGTLFNSMCFSDSINGWISVGGSSIGASVARTKDGGLTWSWEILNNVNISYQVRKFYSSKIGYIEGSYLFLAPDYYQPRCSFTTDGGATSAKVIYGSLIDGVFYDNSNYAIFTGLEKFVKNSFDTSFSVKTLNYSDTSYYASPYRVESTDPNHIWVLTDENKVFTRKSVITSVNGYINEPSARTFNLSDNYPNPFNPSTTISFNIPSKSHVSLKIFDVLGREVATIVNEEFPTGTFSRTWNAAEMSSGVYFYRLEVGAYAETKRLLLLR